MLQQKMVFNSTQQWFFGS